MTTKPSDALGVPASPHLSQAQIQQKLDELETATGQRRIDLITELAWRPAWAIRSRRGVMALFVLWWRTRRHNPV